MLFFFTFCEGNEMPFCTSGHRLYTRDKGWTISKNQRDPLKNVLGLSAYMYNSRLNAKMEQTQTCYWYILLGCHKVKN